MSIFMSIIRNYIWPWILVATFIPRMLLRGILIFINAIIGGYLIVSIMLMATVFPYCLVALFIAHDTTPYWNGIGVSLLSVVWSLIVFAIARTLVKIRDRAQQAIGNFCHRRQADTHAPP